MIAKSNISNSRFRHSLKNRSYIFADAKELINNLKGSRQENFTYDNLKRLNNYGNPSKVDNAVTINNLGNITSKTDAGNFEYENPNSPDGKPNNQIVGGVGINYKDFSFRIENDFFGDGLDRWRSNAVEIGYKNFVIGTTVYTNAPDLDLDRGVAHSRFWNTTKQAYADGKVYSSPLYLGVRHGGRVTRIGIDNPLAQDIFQNGWHIHGSKSSPLFPTPYGQWSHAYRYSGYYNPYSLYYR